MTGVPSGAVTHLDLDQQHRGVGRFDPADLPERFLRNCNPAFSGIQARQLCPRSGMVPVQFDDRLKCFVCDATLLTLEGHQSDQEMRLRQVRVLCECFLASFGGELQLASIECAEPVFQQNFQAGFRMVHVVDAPFLEMLKRRGSVPLSA